MVKLGGDSTGCVYTGLDINVKMLLFCFLWGFGLCVCGGGGGVISTGFGMISMKSYVPSAMQLD